MEGVRRDGMEVCGGSERRDGMEVCGGSEGGMDGGMWRVCTS